MDLLYVAPIRFPTEKAHGIAVANMCAELATKVKLTLVVPFRMQNRRLKKINWQKYYNLSNDFKVNYLPTFDLVYLNQYVPRLFHDFNNTVTNISFYLSLFIYLLLHKKAIVYSRDITVSLLCAILHKPIFIELHSLSQDQLIAKYYRLTDKFIKGYVVINNHLKQELINLGINSKKILVSHSGVNKGFFRQYNKAEIKEKLNFPPNKKIVVYAGSFQKGKGLELLLKAAKEFQHDTTILFCILGDYENYPSLYNLSKNSPNILFTGLIQPKSIPQYLQSADLLVLPNDLSTRIYSHDTSPMKLLEYFASRRPVLSSDVPAIASLEKISEMATFFQAGSLDDLVLKIKKLIKHPDQNKIKKAEEYALKYRWDLRAVNALSFIEQKLSV